jgi:HAD superfamily hydrolase (TIGR01549 family)
LIFDLDGTLVDTVAVRIDAWLRTFEEIGMRADRDFVARLIGSDGKRLAVEVANEAGSKIDMDRAEAIDRRAGERFDELNTNPRPLRGARELLVALEESEATWAIATSSRAEQVKTSVDALKLPKEPKIVDGSHVEHAKPAPDLLLEAADQLDVPLHACWYAGDATWDMLAAKAAGMVGIGLAYGAVSAEELEHAGAAATTTFEELLAELRRRGFVR